MAVLRAIFEKPLAKLQKRCYNVGNNFLWRLS